MKHIHDSDFRYRPSFDTDVRKTFEKIRRQLQVSTREQSTAAAVDMSRKLSVSAGLTPNPARRSR
jgi:hypothetical protein